MVLSNKAYDIMKWFTMIVLPALSSLYVALASVWGLPYAEQIPATIMAVVLCLGAILQFSNANYVKASNPK